MAVMVSLETQGPGRASPALLDIAPCVVQALLGMKSIWCSSASIFRKLELVMHPYFTVTMVQFLWQVDLVNVARFISDGLDIMLGADYESQTSHQP